MKVISLIFTALILVLLGTCVAGCTHVMTCQEAFDQSAVNKMPVQPQQAQDAMSIQICSTDFEQVCCIIFAKESDVSNADKFPKCTAPTAAKELYIFTEKCVPVKEQRADTEN
jgi:hypothetical protein